MRCFTRCYWNDDDCCHCLHANRQGCVQRSTNPERGADAAASGGVRSKPLLAGELARPACKGKTVGQSPCVSGASAASPANTKL